MTPKIDRISIWALHILARNNNKEYVRKFIDKVDDIIHSSNFNDIKSFNYEDEIHLYKVELKKICEYTDNSAGWTFLINISVSSDNYSINSDGITIVCPESVIENYKQTEFSAKEIVNDDMAPQVKIKSIRENKENALFQFEDTDYLSWNYVKGRARKMAA